MFPHAKYEFAQVKKQMEGGAKFEKEVNRHMKAYMVNDSVSKEDIKPNDVKAAHQRLTPIEIAKQISATSPRMSDHSHEQLVGQVINDSKQGTTLSTNPEITSDSYRMVNLPQFSTMTPHTEMNVASFGQNPGDEFCFKISSPRYAVSTFSNNNNQHQRTRAAKKAILNERPGQSTFFTSARHSLAQTVNIKRKRDTSVKIDKKLQHYRPKESDNFFEQFDNETIQKQRAKSLLRATKIDRPLPLMTTIGGKHADYNMATNSSRWIDVNKTIQTLTTTNRQKELSNAIDQRSNNNFKMSVSIHKINKGIQELESVGQLLKIGEKLATETERSRIASQIEVLSKNAPKSPCQGSLTPMAPTIKSPVTFARKMKDSDRSRSNLSRQIGRFKTLNGQGSVRDDPESLLKLFFDKDIGKRLDEHQLGRMFGLPAEINQDLLADTRQLQQNVLRELNQKPSTAVDGILRSKEQLINSEIQSTQDPRSAETSPVHDPPESNHKHTITSAIESDGLLCDKLIINESRFIRPNQINVQSKTFEEITNEENIINPFNLGQKPKYCMAMPTPNEPSALKNSLRQQRQQARYEIVPMKKSNLTWNKPKKVDYPAASSPWRQTSPTIKTYISHMNKLRHSRFNNENKQNRIEEELESRTTERDRTQSPKQKYTSRMRTNQVTRSTLSQVDNNGGSTQRESEQLEQVYRDVPTLKTPQIQTSTERAKRYTRTDLATTNFDSEECDQRKITCSTQQQNRRKASMKIDDASFGHHEGSRCGSQSRAPPSPEYQVKRTSKLESRSGRSRDESKHNKDIELDKRQKKSTPRAVEPSTPSSPTGTRAGSTNTQVRQRYKLRSSNPRPKRSYYCVKQKQVVLVPVPQELSGSKAAMSKIQAQGSSTVSEVFMNSKKVSSATADVPRLPTNAPLNVAIAERSGNQSPTELFEQGPETLRTHDDKAGAAPQSPFKLGSVRPSPPQDEAFSFTTKPRNSMQPSPIDSGLSHNRHKKSRRLANVETMNRDLPIMIGFDKKSKNSKGSRLSPMQSNRQFGTRNLIDIQHMPSTVKGSGAAMQFTNSARRNLEHAASEWQRGAAVSDASARRASSQYVHHPESKEFSQRASGAGDNTQVRSKKQAANNEEQERETCQSDKAIQQNGNTIDDTKVSASQSKEAEPTDGDDQHSVERQSASVEIDCRMKPITQVDNVDEALTAVQQSSTENLQLPSKTSTDRAADSSAVSSAVPVYRKFQQQQLQQHVSTSPPASLPQSSGESIRYVQVLSRLPKAPEPITEEDGQSLEESDSVQNSYLARLASSFQTHHDSLFVRGRRKSNVGGGALADDRTVECAVGSSFKKVISIGKRCIAIQADKASPPESGSPTSKSSPLKHQTVDSSRNNITGTNGSPIAERTPASPTRSEREPTESSPRAAAVRKQVAFNFMSHDDAAQASLYSLGPTVVEYPIYPGSNLGKSGYGVGVEPSSPSPKRRDIILKKKFGPAAQSPSGSPSPHMSPKTTKVHLRSKKDSPFKEKVRTFSPTGAPVPRQELKMKQNNVMQNFEDVAAAARVEHARRSPLRSNSPFLNLDLPITSSDNMNPSSNATTQRSISPRLHTLTIERCDAGAQIEMPRVRRPSPTVPDNVKASKPTISARNKVRVTNLPLAGITPIQEEQATSKRSETASEIVSRLLRVSELTPMPPQVTQATQHTQRTSRKSQASPRGYEGNEQAVQKTCPSRQQTPLSLTKEDAS